MLPTRKMLESSGLKDLIRETAVYYEDDAGFFHADLNVKVIVCDGEPEVVPDLYLDGKVLNLKQEDVDYDYLVEDVDSLSGQVLDALLDESLTADDPEVDLVAAITKAGQLLANTEAGKRVIMILDPGVSTTGVVAMNDNINIQEKSAEDLMDDLADGAFADLSGTSVFWYGLGNVDPDNQTDFSKDTIVSGQVINFWKTYLTACGAELPGDLKITVNEGGVPMVHVPDMEPCQGWYPKVSNVAFTLTETVQTVEPGIKPQEKELVFTETKLAFESGEDTFLNEKTAITELTNQKDYFQQCLAYDPQMIFYVVGSVNQDKPKKDGETGNLSWRRANRVAEVMIDHCGVPEENIRIIGAGMNLLKWCGGKSFDENDNPIYENWPKNRVVSVIPSIFPSQMHEIEGGNENGINFVSIAKPFNGF